MEHCHPKTGLFPGFRTLMGARSRDKTPAAHSMNQVALVGTPNVGKSVIFNLLTGARATVSNYPGTTVEVSRGKSSLGRAALGVVDTPGMYSLMPITEEERVTRRLLLDEHPTVVLHVIDAKNLERMLNLTLQLIEAGLPVVLVVNMIDEARRLGIKIDFRKLETLLGIPVVATSAVYRRGLDRLKEAVAGYCLHTNRQTESQDAPRNLVVYNPEIEKIILKIEHLLSNKYSLTKRATALLLLQGDREIHELVAKRDTANYNRIKQIVAGLQASCQEPLNFVIGKQRQDRASQLCRQVMTAQPQHHLGWGERISRLTMQPLTGIPVLLLVLYFGLYQFVGVFGAGTLVDYLETGYETVINPLINSLVASYVPWPAVQSLLAKDYGVLTLALRYAVAIVLPIVGTFFLVFSVIEDSGYLPRLAMLVDRIFKWIGLSGRAVIPMTLGFGCDTMATMVTRTLESARERVIATLLLALAIPCSAQLGVILAILSGRPKAMAVWVGFILLVFLLVGFLTARLMPGEPSGFYMELPPMRWPRWQNVLMKTYTRMQWYFVEVLPLFILASVLIWLGELTGVFQFLIAGLTPVVKWLGLPAQTAQVFLFGFFRRDYGAAGLFDLYSTGGLTGTQLVVASATLTLFVPCIAQFTMMIKERGVKTAVAIASFIFPFAFLSGHLLYRLIVFLGVSL